MWFTPKNEAKENEHEDFEKGTWNFIDVTYFCFISMRQ
ncbi:hypothetical protein PT2222_120346 [Paraburkholderia tropica]